MRNTIHFYMLYSYNSLNLSSVAQYHPWTSCQLATYILDGVLNSIFFLTLLIHLILATEQMYLLLLCAPKHFDMCWLSFSIWYSLQYVANCRKSFQFLNTDSLMYNSQLHTLTCQLLRDFATLYYGNYNFNK